jgi:hypothetical protein
VRYVYFLSQLPLSFVFSSDLINDDSQFPIIPSNLVDVGQKFISLDHSNSSFDPWNFSYTNPAPLSPGAKFSLNNISTDLIDKVKY